MKVLENLIQNAFESDDGVSILIRLDSTVSSNTVTVVGVGRAFPVFTTLRDAAAVT